MLTKEYGSQKTQTIMLVALSGVLLVTVYFIFMYHPSSGSTGVDRNNPSRGASEPRV